MNAELERDLAAWERGEISHDDLVGRHGAEAAAVTDAHDSLIQATVGLSVDVDDAWAAFSSRLDEPGPVVHLAGRRLRTAALALAAALMLAGSAIATIGPRVAGGSEPLAPSPVSSDGGVGDPSTTDREDVEATIPTRHHRGDEDEGAGVGELQEPTEDSSSGDGGDDVQGDDTQDDDTQDDDQGSDDPQDDDPQDDDPQDDDSQDDDSQDDDDQDDDDQDDDGATDGDQGGEDQGTDLSDDAGSGDTDQDVQD